LPKVSVIIPIYNASKYLKDALDSVINQTLNDIEIICVNDGSTDNSLEILQQYKIQDSRITIISGINHGAGYSRNTGLKIAKGKYIIFLDADDFFKPNMLETAFNECEKYQADFCVFRCQEFNQSMKIYRDMSHTIKSKFLPSNLQFSSADIKENAFQIFIGWAWDKLYSREYLIKTNIKFQEIKNSEDAFFVFMNTLLADKIVIIDKILLNYRTNLNTSLSNSRAKFWNCSYEAISAIKSEMIDRNIYEKFEGSFKRWVVDFLYWYVSTLPNGKEKQTMSIAIKDNYINEFELSNFNDLSLFFTREYWQYKKLKNPNLNKILDIFIILILNFNRRSLARFLQKIKHNFSHT